MSEYREIMKVVNENAHPEAECKYGTAEDDNMGEDAIRVTIIATGLKENRSLKRKARGVFAYIRQIEVR